MTEGADRGELTCRRVHDAPRELLFDCMTRPADGSMYAMRAVYVEVRRPDRWCGPNPTPG